MSHVFDNEFTINSEGEMRIRATDMILAILLTIATLSPALAGSGKEPAPTWEEKYKDEPYVLLKKERVIKINQDYSFSDTIYKKARIQKEEGKSLGEIKLDYDQSRQELKDIEAYTITPDGKKLPYEKLQDLSASGDNAQYSDQRVKVLSMPNVVNGSIIEWKVTYFTTKPAIQNHFYDHFHFTHEQYPVKELICKLIAPKDVKLYFKKQRMTMEPRIANSGDSVVYTWEMKDTDKVQYEEYMPLTEEVQQLVFISTLKDWKQLSDWVWNLFKKNLSITPEIRQKAQELTVGKKTALEKIQSIIEYLRSDFRYVSMNMDFHNYEPHPVTEIFTTKYGDCKDQTLLAMAMLSEIGVQAWPVLLSKTVDLKKDALLPMPFYFSHTFLYFELDGKKYYTDVLLRGYRFDEIPAALAEKKVFVVNETGGFFAVIPPANRDELTTDSRQNVTIKDDGTAVVSEEAVFSKALSVGLRENFQRYSSDYREKVLAAAEKSIAGSGRILDKSWNGIDTPYTRISLKMLYEDPGLIQQMGNMMTFAIPSVKRGSIFSAPRRIYPLVFRPSLRTDHHISYTLPYGYEVIELPNKVVLKTAFADYSREYSAKGPTVIASETSYFNSIDLPAEEYSNVQNFFDDVTRMTVKRVVIRRITN